MANTPKPTPRPQAPAASSAPQPTPAADLAPLDEELEALLAETGVAEVSLKDAVATVIAALGLDERDVQSIEIRPHGTIRLRLEGNVARSVTFPALQRHERDDQNRIIR
jgi:hypothetical protein